MKEAAFLIKEGLLHGLTPKVSTPTDSPYLTASENAVPGEGVVESVRHITDPVGLDIDWPNPRLFLSGTDLILCEVDAVNSVAPGTPWTYTPYSIRKATAPVIESASNPTFTTSATPWTLGANWAWASGKVTHTPGSTNSVSQATAVQAVAVQVGHTYLVTVTMTRTAGSLSVLLGAASQTYTDSGTHRVYLTAVTNGTIRLTPSTDYAGYVDSCSVLELEEFAIPEGGPWRIAPFGSTWFLSNGYCLVWNIASNRNGDLCGTSLVAPKAICNWTERLVVGGIETMPGTMWGAIYDSWRRVVNTVYVSDYTSAWGRNWLIVSQVGGGDIDYPFYVFLNALAVYGNDVPDNILSLIKEYIERRAIDLFPMRHTGNIRQVLPMAHELVVYGSEGVSIVSQQDGVYIERQVHHSGINSPQSAGGDHMRQDFVDQRGKIMRIVPGTNRAQELDYGEHIGDLSTDDLVASWDSGYRHLWLCDGESCFVISDNGLGGPTTQLPTSVLRYQTDLYGISNDPSGNYPFAIRTNQICLNERGMKCVAMINTTRRGLSRGKAAIHLRYDDNSNFRRVSESPMNPSGTSFHQARANDFMVEVCGQYDPDSECSVSSIEVRYNATDKRARRGAKGVPEVG